MLLEDEAHPLTFRLSRRLVSPAGQTIRWVRRPSGQKRPAVKVEYEITISVTLLFNTFQEVDRPVTVGGLVCRDRVEALQRIFEHELLHLAEFLAWGRSNCRADNFHRLSRRIFAHEGAFHDLITPRSRRGQPTTSGSATACFSRSTAPSTQAASTASPAAPPSWSKIRAGSLFDDGKHYLTFYVPLPLLRKESLAG